MRTRMWAVAAGLAGALALAACGGQADEGVATAGGARPDASASAVPEDKTEQGRRFAACMREHGVDMPDPEPGEAMRAEMSKLPKDKLAPALEACKTLLPGGGDALQLDPQQVEQLRALSKCMRENGVEEFPEPDDTGKLRLEGNLADLRSSPKFQQALEKCRDLMPAFKGGGGK
ncbi:hypothetical protein [Catellatospora sp. IY07-71]|uniref:hypothetical protein n=1 Tax=Catellatospora sp. IY07-71 TaxID=2728827 RepID=UPI001BB40697|nr:hypothetical protein [Catellatospora sp. IY07-71]